MTKHTIAHLQLRKLSAIDISYVAIFSAIVIGGLYLRLFVHAQPIAMYNFFYDLGVNCLFLILILSPFSYRFSSAYFTLCFLLLSICFSIISFNILAAFPLLLCLLYQLIRIQFWWDFEKELIPPNIGRGYHFDVYNNIEDRTSDIDDYRYMMNCTYLSVFLLGLVMLIFFLLPH